MFRRWKRSSNLAADVTIDPAGAARARKDSQFQLLQQIEDNRRISDQTHRLTKLRERNHFAELIELSMRRI